jgi:electron-transferring-flavoprotein dehydrogenase
MHCGGKLPWTLHNPTADHSKLLKVKDARPIHYSKPDNQLSFDLLSSVYLSNTHHRDDQPCHLQLNNSTTPIQDNLRHYNEPAQRYCPAGVYDIVDQDGQAALQINAQNCIHCKTCDIKDPAQNITWVTPEAGGGPNYSHM